MQKHINNESHLFCFIPLFPFSRPGPVQSLVPKDEAYLIALLTSVQCTIRSQIREQGQAVHIPEMRQKTQDRPPHDLH